MNEGGTRLIGRRRFVALLGAVTFPVAASAQSDRVRVIGMLLSQSQGDQEAGDRVAALREGLQKLGWTEARNIRIEARYAAGDADRMRANAEELVRMRPALLFAAASSPLAALSKATGTIPIVFAQVTDPVGAGFVRSLAKPGGHITGFTQHEFSVGIKWVELLKELAPQTQNVALLFDPQNPASPGYLSSIKSDIAPFGVHVSEFPVRDTVEIRRAFEKVTVIQNSGLVVFPGPVPTANRELVVALTRTHRIPAVYPFRYWVADGGLASYGVDNIELYRQAAGYVDRILRGENPSELPVQHATKFELVINLKTAKALGISPANTLLARTDEVIE